MQYYRKNCYSSKLFHCVYYAIIKVEYGIYIIYNIVPIVNVEEREIFCYAILDKTAAKYST